MRVSYRIVVELKPDPIDWYLGLWWAKGKAKPMAYTYTVLFQLHFFIVSLSIYRFNHE